MGRIAYITQGLNRASGASKSGVDVLKAISKEHEVEVITHRNQDFSSDIVSSSSKVNFTYVKRDINQKISLRNAYYFTMNIFSVKSISIQSDINLVLINSFCLPVLNKVDFSNYTGKKLCVVRGSIASFKSESSPQELKDELNYLGGFDGYIFVSSNTRDEWMLEPELIGKAAYYIPNCCNENEVAKLRNQEVSTVKKSLPAFKSINIDNKFIISCIGSVQKRKGQDLLVKSVIQLLNSGIDVDILVVLVGGNVDGFEEELRKLIDESGFSNNFLFTGYVKESLAYLYTSDLMVLPSRGEAMPRSVLESMALSVPTITSNLDGMRELIVNGKTGILLDELSVDSLKEAIVSLINNIDLRDSLASSSHSKYWNDFSHERQVSRYKLLLDEVL